MISTRILLSLVTLLSSACLTRAGPILHPRSTCASPSSTDAPYDLSCSAMASQLTCPNGIQGKSGGIVFLVHGTGSTGPETWEKSPYNEILPNEGYDICWVTIPGASTDDMQTNAEYVAYGIQTLAPQSKTGKVFVIGHSQGNDNIQWALAFWPSLQSSVSGFISLAGDFHGTAEGPLVTIPQSLETGGAAASVYQQTVGSNYLAAQNKIANFALVPTTSIYTLTDDIIQPEVVNPTSYLPGATVISTQSVCPADVVDHFIMVVSPSSFYLALSALRNGGNAKRSDARCIYDPMDISTTQQFDEIPGVLEGALYAAIAVSGNSKSTGEPPLKAYVCARGAATTCSTTE